MKTVAESFNRLLGAILTVELTPLSDERFERRDAFRSSGGIEQIDMQIRENGVIGTVRVGIDVAERVVNSRLPKRRVVGRFLEQFVENANRLVDVALTRRRSR